MAPGLDFCKLDDFSRAMMKTVMNQLNLSARAYHRVQKLARAIAELARMENIGPPHLTEALRYEPEVMG